MDTGAESTLPSVEDVKILEEKSNTRNQTMRLQRDSIIYLRISAQWAIFIAYVFAVMLAGFLGMMLYAHFFAPDFLEDFEGLPWWFFWMYAIVVALCFYPIYRLFKFGRYSLIAIESKDPHDVALALRNLKSLFQIGGTFIILCIVLYLLTFGLILIENY
jgi:hypothetical protein